MRCPKCGYLSFDHLDTCLKCNKDISKASSTYEGTTYNVAPPSFLKFSTNDSSHQDEEEISFDDAFDDNDIVDPDLDVLVEDVEDDSDEPSISFDDELDGFQHFDQSEDGIGLEIDAEDDDMDFGQFDQAFEEQEPALDKEISIELPDELSDISDLSPPDDAIGGETPDSGDSPVAAMNDDDFGLSLNLDELGDEFSLSETENLQQEESPAAETGLGDLSLDDIGLADEESTPKSSSAPSGSGDFMDMDGDLDFDLDLGGLSLDKDK